MLSPPLDTWRFRHEGSPGARSRLSASRRQCTCARAAWSSVTSATTGPQARAALLAKDNARRWTWDPATRQLDVRFAPEEALDPWRFVSWVFASLVV